MILEIFGPPGVGKTTFAIALARHLQESGLNADLAISYRPAELAEDDAVQQSARRSPAGFIRRLTRPARELFAAGAHLPGARDKDGPIALMQLLPSRSTVWSLRLRQYIWRLSRSWQAASRSDRCVIYDQAFVQLLCSLALLTDAPWQERMESALQMIPQPDLLVHLDAPSALLRARLIEREHRQAMFERLLEFDLATNLRSIEVIEEIHTMLAQQGRSIHRLACTDQPALQHAVQCTQNLLLQWHENGGHGA